MGAELQLPALITLKGRQPIIRALASRIRADSRTSAILVCGPPGIGKSAVIDAGLERVDAFVGRSKVAQFGDSNPLASVRAALRQALQAVISTRTQPAAALRRLRADVGPLLALIQGEVDVGSDPGTLDRFLESALAVTTAIVKFNRPVVLLIDDLHWAEEQTLALLGKLLKFGPPGGLFVVAGTRLADVGLVGDRLTVTPLDIEDATRLVEAMILGDHALARNIVEIVGAEAASSPFRLLEAVRLLELQGTLARSTGASWALRSLSPAAGMRLESRLARLDRPKTVVLGVASCLGDRFRRSDLDTVVERATGIVPSSATVQDLLAMAVLVDSDGNLRFAHDLLQESAARNVSDHEKRRFHGIAADLHLQRYRDTRSAADGLGFATHALVSDPTADQRSTWIAMLADAAEISLALDDTSGACRISRRGLELSMAQGSASNAHLAFRLSVVFGKTAPIAELERHEDKLVSLAATPMQIAVAFGTVATRRFGAGNNKGAVTAICRGLAALGLPAPEKVGKARAHARMTLTAVLAPVARRLSALRSGSTHRRELFDAEALLVEKGVPALYSSQSHLCTYLRSRVALHQLSIAGSRQYSTHSGMTVTLAHEGYLMQAKRWARLTMDALPAATGYGRASALYRATFFGEIWRTSFSRLADVNRRVVSDAMVEGDMQYVAYGVRNLVHCLWFAGDDLDRVLRVADEFASLLARLGDVGNRRMVEAITQAATCLKSAGPQRLVLDGAIISASEIDQLAGMSNWDAWAICKNLDLQLRVIDGDFRAAREIVAEVAPHEESLVGTLIHPFYCTFAVVAHARTSDLAGARQALRRLSTYARACPAAFAALRDLGSAELAAAQRRSCGPLYERAAQTADRPFDRALIHRLAASALGELGLESDSRRHRDAAVEAWRSFGATRLAPPSTLQLDPAAVLSRVAPVADAPTLDEAGQRCVDALAEICGIAVGVTLRVDGTWRQWTCATADGAGLSRLREGLAAFAIDPECRMSSAIALHAGGILIGAVVLGADGAQAQESSSRLSPLAKWIAAVLDRHRLTRELETVRSRMTGSAGHAGMADEAASATEPSQDSRSAAFLATIGHELRGPLTAVGALIEVQAQSSPSPGDIDTLRAAFLSLRDLVDDLLTVGLSEADVLRVNALPFDPAEAARATARLVAAQHATGERPLRIAIGEGTSTVIGDARRLQQILFNLLCNAFRHAPTGPVLLRVELEHEGGSLRCRFTVDDEGPGLGELGAAGRWRTLAPGLPSSGSGLGLAVSQRIAAALGGTLTAANRGGSGTSLCLEVTFDKAPAVARSWVPSKSLSVLLVDDLELTRTSYATLLSLEGWQVVTAESGERALDEVATRHFDLVLLDLSLPGWDGLETLHRISSLLPDRRARPPLVLFTAMPSPGIVERARAAGADAVLAKPATREEIVEAAAALLQRDDRREANGSRLWHLLNALGAEGLASLLSAARTELPSLVDGLANAQSGQPRRLAAHRLHGFAAHLGLSDLAGFAATVEAETCVSNVPAGLLEESLAAIEDMQRMAHGAAHLPLPAS